MLDMLIAEHELESQWQTHELHAAKTDGQENTAQENDKNQDGDRETSDLECRSPDPVVNSVNPVGKKVKPSFLHLISVKLAFGV